MIVPPSILQAPARVPRFSEADSYYIAFPPNTQAKSGALRKSLSPASLPQPAVRSFLSKNYRLCGGHIQRRTANDRVATGAEKKVSVPRHSAKQKRPGAATPPQTSLHCVGRHRNIWRRRKGKCLRRTTASTSPRPARLWTSSRWRLPARLLHLHHLKKNRERHLENYDERLLI